jgi:hypothetical protein
MDDGWTLVGAIVLMISAAVIAVAIADRRIVSAAEETQARSLERDFRTSHAETVSREL